MPTTLLIAPRIWKPNDISALDVDVYCFLNASAAKSIRAKLLLNILNLAHSMMSTIPKYLCTCLTYIVSHNLIAPSKELCSKMALGEVGMSLPCPSGSRLLRTFFKFHSFFITKKWLVSEIFDVKVETLKKFKFHI